MGTSTRNITDELIRKCRENDRDAQIELYKTYYRQMYNTSLRILNDSAEAEDVMQDSFLDAFTKLADYTGEGNFGGWLRRIVVNNSLDALKKRKRVLQLTDENVEAEEPQYDTTVEENVDYKIEEIKNAVSQLQDDYRTIISLFLFEGYDHEEIAQILNISYGASRTRYSRARQKLLGVLTELRTIKFIHPNYKN